MYLSRHIARKKIDKLCICSNVNLERRTLTENSVRSTRRRENMDLSDKGLNELIRINSAAETHGGRPNRDVAIRAVKALPHLISEIRKLRKELKECRSLLRREGA